MSKRIHVVGISPRTGTTLMVELLLSSYRLDGGGGHERSIFDPPPPSQSPFCSKRPGDLLSMPWLLPADPELWVVCMVRDPRDVVVSRHSRDPSAYWVHLGIWKQRRTVAHRLHGHRRYIEVRYEDLVTDPVHVQEELDRRIPFLERTGDFMDFHRRADPSTRAREALGTVRPVEPSRIGNWRNHKPRLVAQLQRHGPVDEGLRAYGYEPDGAWKRALRGVPADNGRTHFPETRTLGERFSSKTGRIRSVAGYVWRLNTTDLNRID